LRLDLFTASDHLQVIQYSSLIWNKSRNGFGGINDTPATDSNDKFAPPFPSQCNASFHIFHRWLTCDGKHFIIHSAADQSVQQPPGTIGICARDYQSP